MKYRAHRQFHTYICFCQAEGNGFELSVARGSYRHAKDADSLVYLPYMLDNYM